MKLNKHGWGFLEFFAFLAIFIICLIIAGLGLKQLGLIDDDFHFIKDGNVTEKKEEDTPKVTHASLREDMVDATMKYIKKYYNDELGLDTLNIRVSQLKSEGYIEKFEDANGDKCSGYVSVYLDGENRIQYDAYLKCKNFETTGYEERKDG